MRQERTQEAGVSDLQGPSREEQWEATSGHQGAFEEARDEFSSAKLIHRRRGRDPDQGIQTRATRAGTRSASPRSQFSMPMITTLTTPAAAMDHEHLWAA